MRRLLALVPGVLIALGATCLASDAAGDALERGLAAVRGMAGCYLVDYSYTEVESLKAGYTRDARVYDVNRDKSAKEWIAVETLGPHRIRLQRILFLTDLRGALRDRSLIKHQSEDWEYDAPFLYEVAGRRGWRGRNLRSPRGLWPRRVTNLDDGPRYQCAAIFRTDTAYPEWTCSSYAPIPGRETRDMRRADYDTLERTTRIVAYGQSWLERQGHGKTIHRHRPRSALAR